MGETQSLEKEILAINKEYWDGYLTGDWEKSAAFVADNMQMTGSTEDGIFHGKEEVIQFFKDSKEQVVGKLQLRNSEIKIRTEDSLVLTDEYHDIYFKDEKGWSFYEKIRISSVLKSINGQWKYIQQHGSVPDSKVQEGETFALAKISEENLQLKDAVKRRTVELEAKTRELEIDAALERIRKQSLQMQHSDELDETSRIFHEQLLELNIPSEISYVWLPNVEDKKHQFWAAWTEKKAKSIKTFSRSVTYDLDMEEPHTKMCFEVWESDQKYHIVHIPPKELKGFFNSWKEILGAPKNLNPKNFPDGIYYAEAYMKYGCFGINISRSLSTKEEEILQRFAVEFQHTYSRFLDLQKAEAQTREAQIEAALERIRTRSMAMHASEELNEVLSVMFKQIELLGIDAKSAHLTLMDLENNKFSFRITGKSGAANIGEQIIDLDAMPTWKETVANWKKAKPHSHQCLVYPPEILPDLWKLIDESLKKLPARERIRIKDFPNGLFDCEGHTKFGYIGFNNSRPPTEEEINIVIRFAREFERVYQRFLDIKKAEAQAREAQIQLSLERVRARSMAMHSSEELNDVLSILFQQFDVLGIRPLNVWLSLFNVEENTFTYRATGTGGSRVQGQQVIDMGAMDIWQEQLEQWKSGNAEPVLVTFYPPEILPQLMEVFKETFDAMPEEERMDAKLFPDGGYNVQGHTKFGYIGYNHLQAPTQEEKDILLKFATEFERVYQRFLDIEKAEAQAREAQIEAALERVRAKAMAMHSSDDLAETVEILYKELDTLQVHALRFGHGKIDLATKTVVLHTATDLGKVVGYVKLEGHPLLEKLYEHILAGEDLHYTLQGDEMTSYYSILTRAIEVPIPPEGTVQHGYFFFSGDTANYAWSEKELNEEELKVYRRLIKVLNLTYKRYEELRNAESQAREAQIETALERVRAASMAMHKTEEISEVVTVLFDQFNHLNVPFLQIWITILNLDKDYFDIWFSPLEGVYETPQYFTMPSMYFEDTAIKTWKSKAPFSYRSLKSTAEVDEFINACDAITGSTYFSHGHKIKKYKRLEFIEARFEYGFLSKSNTEPPTETEANILQRFAKVFEQAYIRFLDIEKAEAQAREAQIEAALERVRAASMAMHKTEEISEVVTVLFDQLNRLNVPFLQIWITILNLDNDYIDTWFSPVEGIYDTPQHFTMPSMYFEDTAIKTWRSKAPFSYRSLKSDAEVDEFINACDVITGSTYFSHSRKILNYNRLEFIEARHKYGFISKSYNEPPTEIEANILQRFAKVFEQAYTRFLDIEKAEAQARESQIEAALEKVRSRSLAMQSADELQDVVSIVGEKLQELGVILDSGGVVICTYFPDSKDVSHWTASFDTAHPSVTYHLPYFDTPIWKETWHSKYETDDDFFEKVFSFEEKNHFFHYAFEHSDYKNLPDEYKKVLLESETHALSFAWQTNSALMIASHAGMLLPDEHKSILKRFSKVFEQAYIRFMDLQKAEAQAREAQIETALERVRARSLAMHNSKEMQSVANAVYDQMLELGIETDAVGMSGVTESQKDYDVWIGGSPFSDPIRIPFNESTQVQRDYNEMLEQRPELFTKSYSGKIKKEYIDHLLMHGEFAEDLKRKMIESKAFSTSISTAKNSGIQIVRYNDQPYTKEENEILKRFAKVFEQAYIRFMDLQKAEAQARTAQIEASLERVRARSMAMHQTYELNDVLCVLLEQFYLLGINPVLTHLTLFDEANEKFSLRLTTSPTSRIMVEQIIDIHAVEPWKDSFEKWKQGDPNTVDCIDYAPEVLPGLWEVLGEVMNALPEDHKIYPEDFPEGLYTTQGHFKFGYLGFNHTRRATEEEKVIVSRFATEFGRSYQRFLDIQNAEAQAREAQIQLSLERVRAKSMSMQSSDELHEILSVLFQQFDVLEVKPVNVFLSLFDRKKRTLTYRASGKGGERIPSQQTIDIDSLDSWTELFNKWEQDNSDEVEVIHYPTEVVPVVFELLKETFSKMPKKHRVTSEDYPDGGYSVLGYTEFGYLGFDHKRPPTAEEKDILSRFCIEFARAYQRFLDIKKAEKQAKEARIEAALERIRSESLAMQNSQDLLDVVVTMRKEFIALGYEAQYFWQMRWMEDKYQKAMTSGDGSKIGMVMELPRDFHTKYEDTAKWEKSKEPVHVLAMDAETAVDYVDRMVSLGNFQQLDPNAPSSEDIRAIGGLTFIMARTSHGEIGYSLPGKVENPPEEDLTILQRFAKVFDFAHQRFEDLQIKEKQFRETQIQLALEKVRSKAMAMRSSDDIGDATTILFEEIESLGITSLRCGIIIIREDKIMETWTTSQAKAEGKKRIIGEIDMTIHPHLLQIYDDWKHGKTYNNYKLEGESSRAYYRALKGQKDYKFPPGHIVEETHYNNVCFFKEGGLFAFAKEPYDDAQIPILERFASVFALTYRRYLDLITAEKRAREAQIEAALERVRSRSMAMHKSDELSEVIVLLFSQLELLDLVIDTCYIDIFDQNNRSFNCWIGTGTAVYPEKVYLPYTDHPIHQLNKESRQKNIKFYSFNVDEELRDLYFEHFYANAEGIVVPEERKTHIANGLGMTGSAVLGEHSGITMLNYSKIIYSKEENEILARINKVFQQTYTRFLDLQKAEAQAREAQIEAALERVRSRSMAMQHSNELQETALELFQQLENLGAPLFGCGFNIWNEDGETATAWMAGKERLQPPFKTSNKEDVFREIHIAYQQGEKLFVKEQRGTVLEAHYHYMASIPEFRTIVEKMKTSGVQLPDFQIMHCAFFSHGYLMFISHEKVLDFHDVFKRFSKVFEQTYTRFLDLQKAEAQAKEAQIEAALERVRSRTMGMQKSDELLEVIEVISSQLSLLELQFDMVSFGTNNQEGDFKFWLTSSGQPKPILIDIPYLESEVLTTVMEAKKQKLDFQAVLFDHKTTKAWSEHLIKYSELKSFPEKVKNYIKNSPGFARSGFFLQDIDLYVGNYRATSYTDEENAIFKRFAQVFAQAYTRFQDLQKAEIQARDAQIEAGLERLRAASMAMHNSEQLHDVVNVLYKELQPLVEHFDIVNIMLNLEPKGLHFYNGLGEKVYDELYHIPDHNLKLIKAINKAWKSKNGLIEVPHTKHEKDKYFQVAYNYQPVPPTRQKMINAANGMVVMGYFNNNTGIDLIRYNQDLFSEETKSIVTRFSKVFEQTYTRFLDLQKAEQQARESQIEAALERVRSKAMAMRGSTDVGEAITILFEEIEKLGVEAMRVGIGIMRPNKTIDAWTTATADGRQVLQIVGKLEMDIHPALELVYSAWENAHTHISYKLKGEDAKEYYKAISNQRGYALPYTDEHSKTHYLNAFLFKDGVIYIFTQQELNGKDVSVIERFTKVFALTYQRYQELIESEKREREAKKQASLDRVRGEIASMRSTQDLNRITPIIWSELTNLGVPFFRCGVFIMNEEKENIDVFLSDPEGRSLGLMNLDFDTNNVTESSVNAWRKRQIYKAHWNKEEFIAWTQSLTDLGKIETSEKYQGGEDAPNSLHLHFVPFSQGMLYVGNLESLNDDHLALVKNLAESFSIAYARYEDFNKLEKAKASIELALSDLKATQKQLIQSEKMASLGELTAGIAHEIQNPLNFVNNFSEVSGELLEEIEEELENGDLEEVRAILADIKENLGKINNHGRRADSIVKGMLQHSRSSSGEKELTDINQLADEYFNLAYHGLRAKDKTFNSKIVTEFDANIGKIEIVPQEIGRVLLNIINNAFYAVTEKRKVGQNGFQPTVELTTSQQNGEVSIIIKDNGGGMPKKVIDKIFQPFFTTKPTGQGTGLGLSMSYDIIQAHNGQLEVESEEGFGTKFIITLPKSNA